MEYIYIVGGYSLKEEKLCFCMHLLLEQHTCTSMVIYILYLPTFMHMIACLDHIHVHESLSGLFIFLFIYMQLYTYPCLPDMAGKFLFLFCAFCCWSNFASTKLESIKTKELSLDCGITLNIDKHI